MKTSCGKFLNLAHYFPYDVKLRLLVHSRSFLAYQKAGNAIVGAENLLKRHSTNRSTNQIAGNSLFSSEIILYENIPCRTNLTLYQGLWCDGGDPARRAQRSFTLLRDVSRQGDKNKLYLLGLLQSNLLAII